MSQHSLRLSIAILLVAALLACRSAAVKMPSTPLVLTPVSGYVFDLPASQGWNSTGIHLRAGDTFQVAYLSGQIRDGAVAAADASGIAYVCSHAGCCEPLPGVPRDALIGRIGSQVFYIGNGGQFSAPKTGTLELRLNDCDAGLYDNQGALRLLIIP